MPKGLRRGGVEDRVGWLLGSVAREGLSEAEVSNSRLMGKSQGAALGAGGQRRRVWLKGKGQGGLGGDDRQVQEGLCRPNEDLDHYTRGFKPGSRSTGLAFEAAPALAVLLRRDGITGGRERLFRSSHRTGLENRQTCWQIRYWGGKRTTHEDGAWAPGAGHVLLQPETLGSPGKLLGREGWALNGV